jgi:hypothetical protein
VHKPCVFIDFIAYASTAFLLHPFISATYPQKSLSLGFAGGLWVVVADPYGLQMSGTLPLHNLPS